MRVLLLLFLLTGCSVTRFYQGPAVSTELRKNEKNLSIMVFSAEEDFKQKTAFMAQFQGKAKASDPFIKENLDDKLLELKQRKISLISKADALIKANNLLLEQVGDKNKIAEGDPVFNHLENFANKKDEALLDLMKEVAAYKKTSQEFEKIAFFTKMVKR